jgi:hypothetical protein
MMFFKLALFSTKGISIFLAMRDGTARSKSSDARVLLV